MASVQCCKPGEQTACQQHQSLGQKVSQVVSSVFKKDQAHGTSQSHATNNGHCAMATNNNGTHTECHGNGKTRRVNNKKRGLLQKVKDGLSGHSDHSSSSSESDSDDDNKCGRNKN